MPTKRKSNEAIMLTPKSLTHPEIRTLLAMAERESKKEEIIIMDIADHLSLCSFCERKFVYQAVIRLRELELITHVHIGRRESVEKIAERINKLAEEAEKGIFKKLKKRSYYKISPMGWKLIRLIQKVPFSSIPTVIMEKDFKEDFSKIYKDVRSNKRSYLVISKNDSFVFTPYENHNEIMEKYPPKEDMVEVQIPMADEDFLRLAKIAHKQDITFNQLIRKILVWYIDSKEGRRCSKSLLKKLARRKL